jgi:hypothetical protein
MKSSVERLDVSFRSLPNQQHALFCCLSTMLNSLLHIVLRVEREQRIKKGMERIERLECNRNDKEA